MRLGSVRCGLSFSGRVSIIMLQKVSAGIVFCAEDWVYENKDEDIMKARSLEKSGLLAYAIFSEKSYLVPKVAPRVRLRMVSTGRG